MTVAVAQFNRRNFEITGWDTPIGRMYANITCGHNDQEQIASIREALENHENSFTLVAEVITDSLDVAYEKTNHIAHSWLENEEVEAKVETAASTSVGDIMLKDGKAYLVANFGFTKLDQQMTDLIVEHFGMGA